jgi:uncharacterized protein (TIGR03083 family)
MDLNIDQLLDIGFDSAATLPNDVPAGLEGRVVARSLTSERPLRHPGWVDTDDAPLSALSAYIRTASEVAELLDMLAPGDWAEPTRVDGVTVHDIVEHLVGVERYVLGQLGRGARFDAPRREDHWPVSRLAAAGAEPGASVSATWWRETLAVVGACGELGPDHLVGYHHLSGPVRGFLVVRTFELWTHGDDIRGATHRPFDLLDEGRLSLMVNQLMAGMPLGLALSGCPQPGRTARFNLTGAGGGRFDVPLAPGDTPGEPDVTLTTDVIGICRLAANRLSSDQLVVVVEGDEGLVDPILVGATAFAAD